MKTRGIVLQGLDFGKDGDAEHGTPLRLSMFDPMVDSRSITEGKDVAGMNRMSDHVRFLIRGCLRHLASNA